jgi:hypothetical protein
MDGVSVLQPLKETTMQTLEKRIAMEKKMVRHLIRTAKKHGYALARIWDGEEWVKVSTESEAMDLVFNIDECSIFFKHPEEEKAHCALIVLGNDGWDSIADNSMGGKWDAVMEECMEYSDKLCEQA